MQLLGRPQARLRQRNLAFHERRLQHERWFKRLIVLATALALAIILALMPWGVYLWEELTASARSAAMGFVGIRTTRTEVDESWKRFRKLGIDETRPRLENFYAESDPSFQRLLRYAGMDPEHALLRWGNFNWTLLLSSKVFEPDENLSFRFRPNTRSIWLRDIPVKPGLPLFFLVPDEPGLAEAVKGTRANVLEMSRQRTNSWGLRGPEPDLEAPLRGLVLGDSYMQGMFVGDNDTPPEYLRRYLQDHLQTRVSILNTGVMGYSPEQYYHSFFAFAGRFKPNFVVISIFVNDFGNVLDVATRGAGDWQEGRYWLQEIVSTCRARHWPCIVAAVPYAPNVLGRRYSGNYPGTIANLLDLESTLFLDPMEDFLNEHLRVVAELTRHGKDASGCHLFLKELADDHFSPAGAALWAESVGKRLLLLMDRDHAATTSPASVARRAKSSIQDPYLGSTIDSDQPQ
jgi:lysophospholipase L1-like esterase